MTKNPFINAIAATAYISLVASVMFYGMEHSGQQEESVIIPIAVISLFTLSAAMMAYIFMYEPFQLYFSNRKKEGLKLFLQTTATFAAITMVIFAVLLVV